MPVFFAEESIVLSTSCKSKRAWGLCCAAAILLLPVLGTQMSIAQNTPGSYRKTPYKLAPEETHKLDMLKDKVDLPDLPAYTGKARFVTGSVENSSKGGPKYSFCFEADEKKDQILEWYENVFRMYKWPKVTKTESSIEAKHKDGHYATVMTSTLVGKDGKHRTSFTVHYSMAVR